MSQVRNHGVDGGDPDSARIGPLRYFVHVRAGRQAGPDVEELPDPGIAEKLDRADQEEGVRPLPGTAPVSPIKPSSLVSREK